MVLVDQVSRLDTDTCVPLLRACRSLDQGRTIHIDIARSGRDRHTFLGNLLVEMYGRCRSVSEARAVFEGIERKNGFSWNLFLAVYTRNGHLDRAREVFDLMPVRDVVSWNTMFGAYVQYGSLQNARLFFDKTPYQSVVSWNAMISAYAGKGCSQEAVQLFHCMQLEGLKPDEVTVTVVLNVWDDTRSNVQQLEHLIVENGFLSVVMVGNALINLFGRIRRLDKVDFIFSELVQKDIVTWTTRIAAYARNSRPLTAMKLFLFMVLEGLLPDEITFIVLNEVCGELRDLKQAKVVHEAAIEIGIQLDTRVGNSLVSMYGRCGDLASAKDVFGKIQLKDVISWTAMVTTTVQNGHPLLALKLFGQMDLEGFGSDKVACLCVVDACACTGSLSQAKLIHSHISCARPVDSELRNAMLNMYAKCGSLQEASRLHVSHLDIVGWNAMITAYAQNAEYQRAMEIFRAMTLEGSAAPDSVTFIAVLNACSHSGSLKQCYTHFASMIGDHGLVPVIEHYVCIADAMGRVGRVQDAEELLSSMPVKANDIAWRSLLGACGINGDLARGKVAARNIVSLGPNRNPRPNTEP